MKLILVVVMLILAMAKARSPFHKRSVPTRNPQNMIELIMQNNCYVQEHNKRLTCNCNNPEASAFLDLHMTYYTFESGKEIRSVLLKSCKQLLVNLDLTSVDASDVIIRFHAIREVKIEQIQFEPQFSDTQELQLEFNNVEKLWLDNLFIEDTLKLSATNVKEVHLVNSTFAHIPRRGFDVSRALSLNIRNSKFLNVVPQSIVVEKTKEVTVVRNEMSFNAFEVVYAKDGSHLMISCNRLFGKPISPECSRLPITTTTTTPEPPAFPINQGNLREDEDGEDRSGISTELIGGIVVGLLVVIVSIILFVIFMKRKKDKESPDESTPSGEVAMEDKAQDEKPSEPKENDSLLGPEVEVDEDGRPKFISPIWIEEIHKNKMFNKQKSLLSEEGLKEICEGNPEKEAVPPPTMPKKHKLKAPAPPPPSNPIDQEGSNVDEETPAPTQDLNNEEVKDVVVDDGDKSTKDDEAASQSSDHSLPEVSVSSP